jgi:hypothetical protein
MNTFPVEDGWVGYKLQQNTIRVVFECPDQETAGAIINQTNNTI